MLIPRDSDAHMERPGLAIQGKTPGRGHDADSSRMERCSLTPRSGAVAGGQAGPGAALKIRSFNAAPSQSAVASPGLRELFMMGWPSGPTGVVSGAHDAWLTPAGVGAAGLWLGTMVQAEPSQCAASGSV